MPSPLDSTHSRIILVLLLLALPYVLLRGLVALHYSIPSGSMIPTLKVGDYVIATKYPYGFSNFSLPYGYLLPAFKFVSTPPKRGDVVIFRLPSDTKIDYVKRVIGMPGDTVQVIDGVTHINGMALRREAVGEHDDPGLEFASYQDAPLFREHTPEGSSYVVMELYDGAEGDNTAMFTVPEGHYFMMGDNRDNANDSRFGVGFVPEANIHAKAAIAISHRDGTPFLGFVH